MPEFTLKRKHAKTLKINIDDKSYHVPLGGSLTPDEWVGLNTFEGTKDFLCRYIPEEVAKELTIDEWNAIIEAWKQETGKSGKTAGE